MSNARVRLEELWTRWQAGSALSAAEQHELGAALADDESARNDFFADQRIEGALAAFGRSGVEAGAFARQFAARVVAERDGQRFVSSVERRIGREVRWRRLAWWLVPVAATALILALRPHKPIPDPVPTASDESSPAAAPVEASPPATTVARLERARGAVRIEGARRHEGASGAPLSPGWGVVTIGPDSYAVLAFPDGTTLALGADTALMQISEAPDHGRGKEAFLARGKVTADVRPQVWPMKLTTPEAAATVVGTRFALTVERASTRLDVEHGGVEIAPLSGGAPATVRASEFAVVTSTTRAIDVRRRGVALLLVGERALQYDDEKVKQRLEGLGYSVRVRGAGPPDAEALRDTEVILVSSSVFSLDLNTQYRDVAVPVMVWEPSLFDDFGMTGPEENQGCGVAFGTGEAQIKLPEHPMAAGLDGTVTVVSNGKNLHHIWMAYGTPGPAAAWVATWPGLPNRAVLFAYERGAAMPGLPAAPARRVGFFFYDDGRLHLTGAGWTLFDAAVAWAAGR